MAENTAEAGAGRARPMFSLERTRAFIDAVVAIAMTLLILPLMESVGEAAGEGTGAGGWVNGHVGQLLSFVLSFVLIAMFWMNHHRLFEYVQKLTVPLMWLTTAWMLSVVWLPVATAITGQMQADDPVAKLLYIGSLIVTSLLSLFTRLYLRADPSRSDAPVSVLTRGIAVDLAMATLFAASLVLALALPVVGYFALFLMCLTAPVRGIFARLLGAGADGRAADRDATRSE